MNSTRPQACCEAANPGVERVSPRDGTAPASPPARQASTKKRATLTSTVVPDPSAGGCTLNRSFRDCPRLTPVGSGQLLPVEPEHLAELARRETPADRCFAKVGVLVRRARPRRGRATP